jgi:hypothetical protein
MSGSTIDDNCSNSSNSSREFDFQSTDGSCDTCYQPKETSACESNTKQKAKNYVIPFLVLVAVLFISTNTILMTCLVVFVFLFGPISYIAVGVHDARKPTKKVGLDMSTATDRQPMFTNHYDSNCILRQTLSSTTQNNQQIDAILIDLLDKLLTEPVSMAQVKQRRDKTLHVWHAVKDVDSCSDLTKIMKVKIMKLAQNTIEVFVKDKPIMDIAIFVLHSGLSVELELFQNVSNKFLRNVLDFCCHDQTECKWRGIEILISSLHDGRTASVYKTLSYGNLTSMLKLILQSVCQSEVKHITLNKFDLYYHWLNANNNNTDVVQWYAAYAIFHLISTENVETRSSIIDCVNIRHLLKVLKESQIRCNQTLLHQLLHNISK